MTPVEKDPTKGLNAAVAAELRAERAARQVTFDDLSDETGIGRRTLVRLLQAQRDINMDSLSAIAAALDVPATTLMERAWVRMELDSTAHMRVVSPSPLDEGPVDYGQAAAANVGYAPELEHDQPAPADLGEESQLPPDEED